MKKQLFLLFSTVLTLNFLMTSCTEDPLGTDPGLSPSIRLLDGAGFISTSATAEAGATLQFRVSVSAGDDPLELLTIQENNQTIDLGRISYESGSSFTANPALILAATEKQGFTQDISIAGPTSPGNYSYTFQVRDEAQVTANTSITVTVELTPPSLSILSPSSPTEAGSGSTITVGIDAMMGTADFSSIAVYENDVLMESTRLAFNENGVSTAFATNPEVSPSSTSYLADIDITVAEAADSNTYAYRIEAIDSEGLTASATLEVLVVNSIDTAYTGVLVYNKDGQRLGGLNLYTGEAVAFNSSNAQIRDVGIDINLSAPNNWIQKIRAVNSAVLRVPGALQVEGFSFANINTRDALVVAFNTGVTITDSDKVAVGDIFLVQNNDDYFILEVTNIVVTPADNNDYYEFSIKKSCL